MLGDTDEDDPVVKRMPVYLSQELSKSLYLVMYPGQPPTEDELPCTKFEVKPENKQMKMEFDIETRSVNYDYGKGEHIAMNVDGPSVGKDEKMFKSGLMDKLTLESTCPLSDAKSYAIAVIANDEMHLNPLYGCVEMRNYIPYLDASDKRSKEKSKGQGGGGEGEEDEPQQITVKFARQESERVKKARERSFNFLSKKSAEEPWYKAEYHSQYSEKSECLRNLLLCSTPDERPRQFDNFDESKYITLLCPEIGIEDGASGSRETTLRDLLGFQLVDRVRHFLIKSGAISYYKLHSLLEGNIKPLDVMRCLQQVGLLVQGNWVVKSDELYPKDSAFEGGLTAEDMCRGRDYVLAQFVKSHCIQMSTLKEGARLPVNQLREILESLAVFQPRQGWEFKVPYDGGFLSSFPEIAHRQQIQWEARMKNM